MRLHRTSLGTMSGSSAISNAKELQDAISGAKDKLLALYFHASWSPQCKQVDDLLPDLVKDEDLERTNFCKVDAEQVEDVSLKYKVTSVPTFVILLNGEAVDRVEGLNMVELVRKLKSLQARVEMPPLVAGDKRELMHRLQAITAQAPCVLFMEGSTSAPAEGGSSQAVALLKKAGLQFQHFDVTTDSALRQQLIQHLADKAACNYPLLFVNGEFVGGIDEIKKLDDQGQLAHLSAPGNLTLRLQKLINKAPVMVFMKGSPDTPRCGFSRTLMDIFKKHKVTFDSFDILTDEDVRQGLKQYSNWPTYPQVYVKGTLIGGLDIIKELEESGELTAALNP
ncbi:glutaredoxin-3 isoform X3 [Dermacentor silvarum]|uniref:glutaredoxin-3 isoform X3 n=1 Tax=Dermacentor silvarum TaxID=543639 RepID=UPI0021008118|nr:glutaredoxin-3 isoform X3 [Dermacentor silvarum]